MANSIDTEQTLPCVSDAILHWDFARPEGPPPQLRLQTRHFGRARISRLSGTFCRATRSDLHRDRDGGDYLGIICTLAGRELLRCGAQETRIGTDDVVIWRNVGDLEFLVDDFTSKLILLLPHDEIDHAMKANLPSTQLILRGKSAVGGLLSGFLRTLAVNLDTFDEASGQAAVDMSVKLLASALSHETQGRAERGRTTLYERIVTYIDRNLEDRELGPARLAEAHAISLRYLHLLFAQNGQTVAGMIRDKRLEKCRRQIENGGKHLSMAEMAFNWGFSDVPHFSRSFKRRFGLSPRAWQASRLNRLAS